MRKNRKKSEKSKKSKKSEKSKKTKKIEKTEKQILNINFRKYKDLQAANHTVRTLRFISSSI